MILNGAETYCFRLRNELGNPMKRKIWVFNLILAILIFVLLGWMLFQKSRVPETNTDALTPEMEIPAGGETLDEQPGNSNKDDSLENGDDQLNETDTEADSITDDTSNAGSQTNESGDNSGDIVTPEF